MVGAPRPLCSVEQLVETITVFGKRGFTAPGGPMNLQLGAGVFLIAVSCVGVATAEYPVRASAASDRARTYLQAARAADRYCVRDTVEMRARGGWAAMVVACLLAAVGCTDDDASTSTTVPDSRTITGTLMLVGGPSGADPIPAEGEIDLVSTDGQVVGTTRAGSDGHFSLRVPPGTYQVIGRSPQYQSGGADCSSGDTLTVETADATDVVVACQMK